MKYDYSPVPHTCPILNRIKDFIQSIYDCDEKEKENAIDFIEEVRNANSELREWGNKLFNELDDLKDFNQRTVSRLESENGDLHEEIRYLKAQIRDLE